MLGLPGPDQVPQLSSPSPVQSTDGFTAAQPISRPAEADASPSNDYGEKEGEDVLEQEDDNEYPRGFKLAALTTALMLATFMVALDTNVIGEQDAACSTLLYFQKAWTIQGPFLR